jgi:hypothetical protein
LTKPNHIGALKFVAVIIAILMSHPGAFSESARLWYVVSSKNTNNFSLVGKLNPQSQQEDVLKIECPENISTYTDINECTAYISNSLNIVVTEGSLTGLTWEMTGATQDASRRRVINQIDNYVFNEGTTRITYTATNKFKNSATCSFTVVISDNQVPKLVSAPENITVEATENECGAYVSWTEPVVVDNCTPSDQILKTSSHNSGSYFPLGTTTVTYIFNDGMATTKLDYSFTVTVTDKTAPLLIAPENITVTCGEVLPGIYSSYNEFISSGGTATDNCQIKASSFTLKSQTQSSQTCPYTIIRTYQISDVYNNVGTVEQMIFVEGKEMQSEPTQESTLTLKSGMGIMATSMEFTSSGPFIVPVGVVQITVECWGGGGGGSTITSNNSTGGGGGGGAFASSIINVIPLNSYNVIVGTGGGPNSNGGNSSFNGTSVIAAGGNGAAANSATRGLGGTIASSTGTIRWAGGNGGDGGGTWSGGGGGGAGSTGNGGNAPSNNTGTAGTGATFNGGNGGTGVNVNNTNGNSGFLYGGGGSGSKRQNANVSGGSGAPGYVLISFPCINSLTSAIGTDNQTTCLNTAIAPITYLLSGDGITGATVTGLPNGVTSSFNPSTGIFTISGTPSQTGNFPYNVTPTGGCETEIKTGTINVVSLNTITLSSAAGTDNQTTCLNTPITNINYSIAGATGATFSGLPAGVTGSLSAGNVTISGTPTVSGSFGYSVSTTGLPTCANVSKNGNITVNFVTPGSIVKGALNQGPDCAPLNPNTVGSVTTAAGPTGSTISHSWEQSTDGGTTWIPAAGSSTTGNVTFNPNPMNVTTILRRVATSTLNGISCSSPSNTLTYTVWPLPVVTSILPGAPITLNVCVNNQITLTNATSGGIWSTSDVTKATVSGGVVTALSAGDVIVSYTVTDANGCSKTANRTVHVIPLPSVSTASQVCVGSTVNILPSSGGTWLSSDPTKATITNAGFVSGISAGNVTMTFTDGTTGCSATTLITVHPTPTVTSPGNLFFCNGIATAAIPLAGTPVNVVFDIAGGSAIGLPDQTDVTQIPIFTPIAGSAIISITPKANGCTGTTVNVTFTVRPNPVATATPTSQSVCSGNTTNISLSSNIAGTVFTWTVVQTGVSGASPGNGSTITQTLTATGNAPGTATYTITPSANGCAGAPITVIITVDPKPVVTATPASQVVCSGTAPNISLTSNVAGTTFDWTIAELGVNGASAGGGTTIDQVLTATWAVNGTATYTVTPTANGCAGNPINVVVTVTPSLQVTVSTSTPSICPGGNVNITFGNVNNLPATYSWTRDNTSVITGLAANGSGNTITGNLNSTDPRNSNSTVFTVTASLAGCNSSTTTISVEVIDNVPPAFTISPSLNAYTENNCTVDLTPAKIGGVTNLNDNCSLPASLVIEPYVDGLHTPGTCTGNYSFVRTWTVKDVAGNATVKTQTINVNDDDGPVITLPVLATIQCGTDLNPAIFGRPSAVDACGGTVTLTSSPDIITGTGCSYTVTRTWTATDECGNISTAVQTINIADTKAPTIVNVANQTVHCPADIPLPDISVVTATDECGTVTVTLYDERAIGLADKPGYCPTSMERDYKVSDGCGNFVIVTHYINIDNDTDCWESGTCEACSPSPGNPELGSFFTVDLRGNPEANVFFPDVYRQDKCCDAKNQEYCASFNVILDENAVGVEVQITNPAPSGQDWKLNCGDHGELDGGRVVCLPGGVFNLFTYCAAGEGNNRYNDWRFISYSGVVVEKEIDTRVNCNTQITATGVYSDPHWTSVYPGNRGDYDQYLFDPLQLGVPGSGTTVTNPIFIAPLDATGEYQFELCAITDVESICSVNANGQDCDIVTINVVDAIGIDLQVNPDLMCSNDLPFVLTPEITPLGSTFKIEWFSGQNALPAIKLGEGPSWTISAEGDYSIKVTDLQEGIECNTKTFNFVTQVDLTGPTYTIIPPDLVLSCDDPDYQEKINAWRASAKATYTDANGNVRDADISDDFSFDTFDLSCHEHVVNFTSYDNCENQTPNHAKIIVYDNVEPVITCPPADDNIADLDKCLIEAISLDPPVANDNCSTPLITWEKNGATNGTGSGTATGPFNVGVTIITYTATDACLNTKECTQQITIVDEQEPNFLTCPDDVTVTAPPPLCELQNLVIGSPTYTDNCGTGLIKLTWVRREYPSLIFIDAGSDLVDASVFNVGITQVTYTIEDAAGNKDDCSFLVTVNDQVPPTVTTCYDEPIVVNADPTDCAGDVTILPPVADDLCGNIVSITHDSPWGNTIYDASGRYPVNLDPNVPYVITWTVLDASGNTYTLCQVQVTVLDPQVLNVACPPSITQFADEGEYFATGITVDIPDVDVNCFNPQLTWVMDPPINTFADPVIDYETMYTPDQLAGSGIFVGPGKYYVGVTTVTYTLTDENGKTATCFFTITIKSAPFIECPPSQTFYADDNCTFLYDPGVPLLIQGGQPIDWTWTLSWPGTISDPAVNLTGGSTTTNLSSLPSSIVSAPPHEYDFQIGITTITWTATNDAGVSTCTQTITVIDDEKPTFNAGGFVGCVENLMDVTYTGVADILIFNIDYPDHDYYLMRIGSFDLDLDMATYSDNCCAPADNSGIRWEIDFEGVAANEPTIWGIGQPSDYASVIYLWGDGVNFLPRTHKITYWITDCHGIESDPVNADITINPRPKVGKL